MEWLMVVFIICACVGDILLVRKYRNDMEKYQREMQKSNQAISSILDKAMLYFKEASMTCIVIPNSPDKE
jgi:hypothetical protein